jgi:serine/threonine-protein kinase
MTAEPRSDLWLEASSCFDELVELGPAERRSRLDALHVADPELAREVRELLEAYDAAGELLDQPAVDLAPTLAAEAFAERDAAPSLAAGSLVGGWRLVRPLGAGGMGEVWEVERADGAFEQRAALKLLKRGLDSDGILRRFHAERQILARLRHRSIAHLYDGGVAPDGRPFFVMERVEGVPITTACARRGSPVEERLRLLVEVCEAVETAHRSLVVHRDLKPSNVLVTAAGEVKLLDFGIAKLLGEEGSDGAATRAEERLLTPAYAAPEQILGEPVTTAADVYSLGVLLYELLAGRLPHRRPGSRSALVAADVDAETVERPSTAVRREPSPEETREALSAQERSARSRRLRGDLDWIVLRALAREPERRYASAAALASDLVRHLRGLPVEARPDSLRYRAVKFVRRNRLAVASAALVLLSLLGGLAAALWQAREARAQAARAERVKELLADVFHGADPEQTRGAQVTARELLEQGTRRVEAELGDEPEIQAELLVTIAQVEEGLGLLDAAHEHASRALQIGERSYGAADRRLLPALVTLGSVLSQLERDAESLLVRERLLAIARRDHGTDSLEVARAETEVLNAYFGLDRFEEALPLAEHALAVKRRLLGEDHLDTIRSKLNLAFALDFLDRVELSLQVGQDALDSYLRALGPEDPRTLEAMHNQAVSLAWVGRSEEAIALFERAIAGRRRVLGPADYRLAWSLQQSSLPLRDLERWAEAEAAAQEALGIFLALDPRHPEAAGVLHGLALSDFVRGELASAEARLRRVLADWEEARGPDHRSTLQAKASLALVLAKNGRAAEAEDLAREALAGRERGFGPSSAYAAHSRWALGEVLLAAGRHREAAAEHERALAIASELFGEAHATTVRAGIGLALARLGVGDAGSLRVAEEALDRAGAGQREIDPEHSRLAEIDLARARLALARGAASDAVRLAEAARARFEARLGAGSPAVAEAARLEQAARKAGGAAGAG